MAVALTFGLLPPYGKSVTSKFIAALIPIESSITSVDQTGRFFPGMGDLLQEGTRNLDDKRQVQTWIREHSPVETVLCPPLGNTNGWQIFSERACIMRPNFVQYISFSRDLALHVDDFLKRYPLTDEVSWAECVRFGSAEGADLILVDDRIQVHQPGDPLPLYSSGYYHVLRGRTNKSASSVEIGVRSPN